MTILLVDDERPAIEALCQAINWQSLGFSRVETAYDAGQARRVLETVQVAVLLCDIEMPGDSGLLLLQWAQTHTPATVSILFTCHADFDYARQAVTLGAFDYLLKPSTMETVRETVLRAAAEWRNRQESERQKGQWEKGRNAVLESFWLKAVLGELPRDRNRLVKAAFRQGLEIDGSIPYTLLLCTVRQWRRLSEWDAADLDYAFRNLLTELFTFARPPIVLSESARRKFLLLPDYRPERREIEGRCQKFFDVIQDHFGAGICFYAGDAVPPEKVAGEYRRLEELERQNVSYDSRVYFSTGHIAAAPPEETLDMARWQQILETGDGDRLCGEVNAWLDRQVSWGKMSARTLELFYHDLLQMLYTTLSQRHISAVQLLREQPEDAACRLDSLEAVRTHLEWLIRRSCGYLGSVSRQNELVEKVKTYIQEHLAEDLSRDLLAGEVYLNPNYLSRLFHQETGQSLVDYITSQRLEKVKQLLRDTSLSVTEAAGQLGYTNMPYFSRVFRKEAGCSPVEYRRRFQK